MIKGEIDGVKVGEAVDVDIGAAEGEAVAEAGVMGLGE